jgi:hypothetical protein
MNDMDLPNNIKEVITIDEYFNRVNKAQKLYLEGNYKDAYEVISGIPDFTDMLLFVHFRGENFRKKEYEQIYHLAGCICAEVGKDEEAEMNFIKHQYLCFQLNHDFVNNDSITLYKFYGGLKSYVVNNIKNNQISLVDPRIQNDIVDSPIFAWLEALGKEQSHKTKHFKAYCNSFNGLRSASFCEDHEDDKAVENTLMWAHYANCHKGFCIQYQLNSKDFATNNKNQAIATRMFRIQYLDPKIDPLDFADKTTSLSPRKAFACKSNDWEYEHEVRLVSYVPLEKNKYASYVFETPNPIKAVYFGYNCPTRTKNAVQKLLIGQDVSFYQMQINQNSIHRLVANPC